jgi:hypothetical protein
MRFCRGWKIAGLPTWAPVAESDSTMFIADILEACDKRHISTKLVRRLDRILLCVPTREFRRVAEYAYFAPKVGGTVYMLPLLRSEKKALDLTWANTKTSC